MKLHEGELIRRTLIRYREESSGAANRTLLDIMGWLGTEYKDMLNRIVLYVTALGDSSSDIVSTDVLILRLKSYAMTFERRIENIGDDLYGKYAEEIEFPLCVVDTPVTATDLTLTGRAPAWLATEAHIFLIEVQAYLLDEGPSELLIRTF